MSGARSRKVRDNMTNKEYEKLEKTAFQLEQRASQKQSIEVAKANNYRDGYAQALSDMLHAAKDSIKESEVTDGR